jgi:hypothetical protein
MSPRAPTAADADAAPFVPFEAFRDGAPVGRFRIIVNPALVGRFVGQRVNATPIAVAVIGTGVACAVGGWPWPGAILVGLGVLFRRMVKWQAAKILLHLAVREPRTYYEATTAGVMEVQPREAGG